MNMLGVEAPDSKWSSFYKVGGMTALLAVVVALVEILITFVPGGERTADSVTVQDWFALFQSSGFFGLRNLGLLNLIGIALMTPTFLALYAAHRRVNTAYAAFSAVLFFIGIAVYIASNRAFAMWSLSSQYAAATTEAQRSVLLAAGEALLAVGQSHTPGTFPGFFLTESAGLLMSLVMLQGHVFSRAAAYTGILGWALLILFDICSAFVPALFDAAMIFVMVGGLLMMAWYILVARRLFQLGRLEAGA